MKKEKKYENNKINLVLYAVTIEFLLLFQVYIFMLYNYYAIYILKII